MKTHHQDALSVRRQHLKIARHMESLLHKSFGTTHSNADAVTIDDMLVALARLTYLHYETEGQQVTRLIRPDAFQSSILKALDLAFPSGVPV